MNATEEMLKKMRFNIHCRYSGLHIGTLDYAIVAGHQPFLSHWKEMQAMHPVFSMETGRLLAFTRKHYEACIAKSEDQEASLEENSLMQVSFLACLHSLGSVVQEAVSLPPMHIVHSQMKRIVALAYWKHYLNSTRFSFPTFKINRVNSNTRFDNIEYYLDACFEAKDAWSKQKNDLEDTEKAAAAERAMLALRNSWVTPVSKAGLYRWVRAHLPAKYEADAQGWMSTLFLGNDKTVLDFDLDETELMEQIICTECPAGTGVLKAVRNRIDSIKQTQKDHKEAFSVDFSIFASDDDISLNSDGERKPQPEPVASDYPNKVLWMKARAIWFLQQSAANRSKGL